MNEDAENNKKSSASEKVRGKVPAIEAAATAKPVEDTKAKKLKVLATTGWTSYVMVTIGLVIILFAIVAASRHWVNSTATELTKDFKLEDKSPVCKFVTDTDKQEFITRQKAEIVRYGNSHHKTAIDFYGYFYATFVVFSVFGLLSAMSLAIIAKNGYNSASPHLITVFMVSTGIVILYQGFFGVFQQKTNIDNNAKLFSNYSKLLTKIDTYCTTGKIPIMDPVTMFNVNPPQTKPANTAPANTAANTKPAETTAAPTTPVKAQSFYISLDADEFINYVGWQMEQYKAISISLDDKQITNIDNSKFLQP